VVGVGRNHIVLYIVLHQPHLDVVVHQVRSKVPVCSHVLQPFGQLVELPQGGLSEKVEVKFQGDQAIVGLERLCDHFESVVVDGVVGHVEMNEGSVL